MKARLVDLNVNKDLFKIRNRAEKPCLKMDNVVSEDKKMAIEEFSCPVCNKLMYNPVSCSNCKRMFGNYCFNSYIKQRNCCPCCPKDNVIKNEDNDLWLIEKLSFIKLRCDHKGCSEIIEHESYYTHLNTCRYNPNNKNLMTCKFCKKQMFFFELNEHYQNCEKKVEKCEDCGKDVLSVHFVVHLINECDSTKVICDYCGDVFSKRSYQEHFKNLCNKTIEDKLKQLSFGKNPERNTPKSLIINNQASFNSDSSSGQIKLHHAYSNLDVQQQKNLQVLNSENNQMRYHLSNQSSNKSDSSKNNQVKQVGINQHIKETNQANFLQTGIELKNKEKYKEALDFLFLSLNQSVNPLVLLNIGDCKRKLNNYTEALYYYEQCIKEDRNCKFAYFGIGLLYLNKSMYIEAINSFNKATQIDNNLRAAFNNIGWCYQQLGITESACKMYKIVISLNPGDALGYFNLGCVLQKIEKHKEAIHNFKEAIKIEKNHDKSIYNTGCSYYQLGYYIQSIIVYLKVTQINPNYQEAFFGLGLAYEKLNDKEKALEAFLKLNDLNPKFAGLQRKIEQLTS